MSETDIDFYLIHRKIMFKECKYLPHPFDEYAYNYRKWAKAARRETPPGRCLVICAIIKSLLDRDRDYIDCALKITKTDSDEQKAVLFGLTGMVLCQLGHGEEGIQFLRESVSIDPDQGTLLNLASELGEYDNSIEESIDICNSVLGEKPHDSRAKRILAINFMNKRNYESAKELVLEILQRNPKDRFARRVIGDIFYNDKDYINAIIEYKKAKSYWHSKPYLDYRLAHCYYNIGKLKKSKKYAKNISEETFRIAPYFIENAEEIKRLFAEIQS